MITFDLDNTLWDVEPALLRAEQAQQDWLRRHRPGAVEAYDHEGLWELKNRFGGGTRSCCTMSARCVSRCCTSYKLPPDTRGAGGPQRREQGVRGIS